MSTPIIGGLTAIVTPPGQLRSVGKGECALSTGDELWWIGPIADLARRLPEFPKADTLTLNQGDVDKARAQFESKTISRASA